MSGSCLGPDERAAAWLGGLEAPDVEWGCFSSLGEVLAAETLGRVGYDFVLVDLQHGVADMAGIVALLAAIENGGAAPVVRVRANDAALIGRALDAGAWVVVVPMVETRAQAEAAVAASRFAPAGTRSFGPFRGRAVDETSGRVLVMVETALGLANVGDIASTPGLLGIFVGPSDLAISLGLNVDYEVGSGSHHEAVADISSACRLAGVVAAIQTSGAEEARLRATQGYSMISMRSDWLLLRSAAAQMLADALHL